MHLGGKETKQLFSWFCLEETPAQGVISRNIVSPDPLGSFKISSQPHAEQTLTGRRRQLSHRGISLVLTQPAVLS